MNPHIIYKSQETGRDRLEYAYKDSTGWHIEIIYEGNVYNPSIVLDSNDNPLISYTLFPKNHPVFYFIHKDNTGWHAEEFDDPEFCSWHSMALDSSDNIHISYRCNSGFDQWWKMFMQRYTLKYAKRVGTQWHREVVDRGHTFAVPSLPFFVNVFGNHIANSSSIALDLNGKPHIVYLKNCFDYFTLFYLFSNDAEPGDSSGMTSLKHATRFGCVD